MDATKTITKDHEEVRKLIGKISETDDDVEFAIAQLRLRLITHAAVTETQIYRELVRAEPGCADVIGKHTDDHRRLASRLDDVGRAAGTDDFESRLRQFTEAALSELDREEATVLPLLRDVFSAENLDELGRQFELRLLAELDARTPPGASPEPTA